MGLWQVAGDRDRDRARVGIPVVAMLLFEVMLNATSLSTTPT
jgi:hypothetical protein